jgi:predicted RNA-binding protein (virulence factor B family)
MIQVGRFNKLSITRKAETGLFLDGGEAGEILLPHRYAPAISPEDSFIEVFIYFDSEDRIIATTESPIAQVGEFASLKVVDQGGVGAFLNWGLSKDLFLPFSEQTRDLKIGQSVIVYIFIDKSGRISASMRLDRHLEKNGIPFQIGDKVSALIAARTDLGFKAIIENRFWGVLYENEVFKPLRIGERIDCYIKNLRADEKIDLSLQRSGYDATLEDVTPKILAYLSKNSGFLAFNEKTPPEEIYRLFGVSKKKFKIAIGALYKKRVITIGDQGIHLVK